MRYKGDVNGDGRITIDDMLLIKLHIIGKITLSGEDYESADVNGDGLVNVSDLIRIRNHVNGSNIIGGSL
jgi:hypothetical protein